jgi:hypothetical protein
MNITGKEEPKYTSSVTLIEMLRLEYRQTRIILPPQRNPRRVKNLNDGRHVRG